MKIKQLYRLLALALPFIFPQIAIADALSLSIGGGTWDETPEGTYNRTIDASVDINDDLLWEKESQGYAFITFEHFVPIIPNIKLIYTKIDHTGSGTGGFNYNGITYGDFANTVTVETLDLLLYYEVLDNVVSLDLGLNIRNLKADFKIIDTATNITDSDSVDEIVPMVYALVGFSPWPDLIISGEMSYVTYSGNTISDYTVKIAYTTNFFIGLEAGYRNQKIELDDIDGTDTNITFDGPFAGAYLKF